MAMADTGQRLTLRISEGSMDPEFQKLRIPCDGVQGCTELMAHCRQEGRLRPVPAFRKISRGLSSCARRPLRFVEPGELVAGRARIASGQDFAGPGVSLTTSMIWPTLQKLPP